MMGYSNALGVEQVQWKGLNGHVYELTWLEMFKQSMFVKEVHVHLLLSTSPPHPFTTSTVQTAHSHSCPSSTAANQSRLFLPSFSYDLQDINEMVNSWLKRVGTFWNVGPFLGEQQDSNKTATRQQRENKERTRREQGEIE